MGASVHIIGVRDMGEKFKSMLELKKMCEKNKVSYPQEVKDYFGIWVDEDEECIRSEMQEIELKGKGHPEYGDGMYINVKDIPEDVKQIRVYMS